MVLRIFHRAKISSIRSIGRRARSGTFCANSLRGLNRCIQSRSFLSVFNFLYLHWLQRQLSAGICVTSTVAAPEGHRSVPCPRRRGYHTDLSQDQPRSDQDVFHRRRLNRRTGLGRPRFPNARYRASFRDRSSGPMILCLYLCNQFCFA